MILSILDNTVQKQTFAVDTTGPAPLIDISALSGKRLLGVVFYDASGDTLEMSTELGGFNTTDPDDAGFFSQTSNFGTLTPLIDWRPASTVMQLIMKPGYSTAKATIFYFN
jgi:hypothetical protein